MAMLKSGYTVDVSSVLGETEVALFTVVLWCYSGINNSKVNAAFYMFCRKMLGR